MDIFTTQLTRVVPTPIKPANLKVKALLKEAGTGKLKEDLDHLENHDYYFGEKNSEKEQSSNTETNDENLDNTALKKDSTQEATAEFSTTPSSAESSKSGITESEDGTKHLDLFV